MSDTFSKLFYSYYCYQCAACILPAYFQYPPPPRKRKKEKNSKQCFIVHRAFYFVLNIMIYCWTCVKGNGNYHLISHLLVITHQIMNYLLFALLVIIEVCNKLQSPCLVLSPLCSDEHRLSLGMLMHVKCIHELCSLLSHIPMYLHHI